MSRPQRARKAPERLGAFASEKAVEEWDEVRLGAPPGRERSSGQG